MSRIRGPGSVIDLEAVGDGGRGEDGGDVFINIIAVEREVIRETVVVAAAAAVFFR